ncbi:hypothetical protein FKW77_000838 [Venturia effusa]|uniref:Dienelactone hydrolase domain-containing protein n=1 Tax=Venturia effusa TaxID=50376 RepID=A0A517KYY8_9PEZI|nr:hypothetical protein FKW77_000838 [Venturia effusa]
MSCPSCFQGHIHDGTPSGRIMSIHSLETYVAEPAVDLDVKGIIIIIPDAFGLPFVNNKLLADHYAEKGQYKVYLPDFMNGAAPTWLINTMAEIFEFKTWMDYIWKPYNVGWTIASFGPHLYRNRWSVAWPKVQKFFNDVRCNEGFNLPIGAAGFCWGGKHSICLAHPLKASNGQPLCDASFAAHPSNVEIPRDIEPVKQPLAFALGDEDFVMDIPTLDKMESILKRDNTAYQVRVYQEAGHGFAVRADPKNEKVMEQSIEAENQAIKWFQTQFEKRRAAM